MFASFASVPERNYPEPSRAEPADFDHINYPENQRNQKGAGLWRALACSGRTVAGVSWLSLAFACCCWREAGFCLLWLTMACCS